MYLLELFLLKDYLVKGVGRKQSINNLDNNSMLNYHIVFNAYETCKEVIGSNN